MPTTPSSALPYPAGSDAPNVPFYIQNLATAVDGRVITKVGSAAARDALGLTGNLLALRTDTGDYESNYGGEWSTVAGPLVQAKVWRTTGNGPSLTADVYTTVDFNASRLSGGFTFDNTNNTITVPKSGHYEIRARGYAVGGSGYFFRFRVMRQRASVADREIVAGPTGRKIDAQDESTLLSDTLPLQVGDKLRLEASFSSSSGTYNGSSEGFGVQLAARYVGPLSGAVPF